MIERFSGAEGQRLLVEAVRLQKFVGGDASAAAAIASVITLSELSSGSLLFSQGADDNDLYLILSGVVEVRVNGRVIATRIAGQHVGELSLIDPGARRSASIVAAESVVVGKVSEPAFSALAENHPRLWRAIALEIGERLRQRARFVTPPNDRPIVFIGSSSEALPVAELLRAELQSPEIEVHLWTDGIFTASRFPMEDLEKQLGHADFAILVVSPDDVVTSRGDQSSAPRDNVVFELGLFMGALTRPRAFMVVPKSTDMKIPSDLLGLNQLRYDSGELKQSVAAIAGALREKILTDGPR